MNLWSAPSASRSGLGLAEVPRIVVIGGGIAGLAAAHRLLELSRARRRPLHLILVEARDRLGGTISTERADGFLIEGGPDSFLTEKPWAAALCDRLGLADRLIYPSEGQRRTFVVRAGRLIALPDGFLLLAPSRLLPFWSSPLLSWRGKVRAMMDLVLPSRPPKGDESIAGFVGRRLGSEVLDHVVRPLLTGIYTADPSGVSVRATMPGFAEMERRHGSVIRGLRRAGARRRGRGESGPRWALFATPAGGMDEMVSALADRLPAASLKLGRRATSVSRSGGPRTWRVGLADGAALLADAIILAVPAPRGARLLAAVDRDLARELGGIPYHSSATVTLAYRRADVRHPLDGLGFVVPEVEGSAIFAGSFASLKYPGRAPEGAVLLRAFAGGGRAAAVLERDDTGLAALVEHDLGAWLGTVGPPVLVRVHRHVAAMPQYEVGHAERVARLRTRAAIHRGLALCGNAFDGVGIPDCVHSGETAAEAALASVAGGPAREAAPG